MKRWFAMLIVALTAAAHGQTFYEPIEYQYRVGGTIYFYGGDNPRVHAFASEPHAPGAAWGRQGGFAFSSASVSTGRAVEDDRVRVFSDAWRSGFSDATIVGFTVADARNEALAAVPRYFRKGDLLGQAAKVEGAYVVPARAGGVVVRKSSGERVTNPTARPLLVIPRDRLIAPAKGNLQAAID